MPSGVFEPRDVEPYLAYVEHPEASKHRWVRCIAGRSRKLVRYVD